jgi:hypothetical protein
MVLGNETEVARTATQLLPRPEDSPAIAAHNLAAKRIKLRLCKITMVADETTSVVAVRFYAPGAR